MVVITVTPLVTVTPLCGDGLMGTRRCVVVADILRDWRKQHERWTSTNYLKIRNPSICNLGELGHAPYSQVTADPDACKDL